MANFISNYKAYIEANKYKQSFIALKTGMDVNKISRILTEKQPVIEEEMNCLSNAVGKDISFFLMPDFKVDLPDLNAMPIACYIGSSSVKQKELITDLIEFAESIDVIIGSKFRVKGFEVS